MAPYRARAEAASRSYYENGKLVLEGAVIAEGESPLELAAATDLGKALVIGQSYAQGVVRALASIAQQTTLQAPKINLLPRGE